MLKFNKKMLELVNEIEKTLCIEYDYCDNLCYENSKKVLNAFHKYNLSESDLNNSTGYGYNDIGRDKIEKIYADIFNAEDALVRCQIVSGTHAITIGLQGILRPNDTLLVVSGKPYDTLDKVIGIEKNNSSLISYGIKYKQIDLLGNDFDYNKIIKYLEKNKVKMIYIQRSRGYSLRESLSIPKLKKLINEVKKIDSNIIIFVDNCYCEFVEDINPIDIGASICAGSLIKNLGGGIATSGGYLVGNKDLIELCSERLTVPGCGKELGSSLNSNKMFLQGLYYAPSAVCNALKIAILTSKVLFKLGYQVYPKYFDFRVDIVQAIEFNDKDTLINYTIGLQSSGAIDAHVKPIESELPGYNNKIIMASPSFVQGSSIEISGDGPIKEPYVIYQQGAITYEYGKIALINALSNIKK